MEEEPRGWRRGFGGKLAKELNGKRSVRIDWRVESYKLG